MFLAFVLAMCIVVLTPTPLLADGLIPLIVYTGPLIVLGLIPVIIIESLVLQKRLRLRWTRAWGATTVANIASMLIGFVVSMFLPAPIGPGWGPNPDLYVFIMVLFVPFFFVSWGIEFQVAKLILKPKRPPSANLASATDAAQAAIRPNPPEPEGRIDPGAAATLEPAPSLALRPLPSLLRGMFDANVASYVFLAIVVAGLWLQALRRPPEANQSCVLRSLGSINASEITYSSTYNIGFSSSLSALTLEPAAGQSATAEAADLMASFLATGERCGYEILYSPGPRDEKGMIYTYSVRASPHPGWKGNSYYTDQTGVIRWRAAGPATATDAPLGE
jgi:hypothetical protein